MYGITQEKKEYIDKKISKNKTFLKNLTFYNEDYNLISMFDTDMNANLSPQRYFAEVNNRVNTLFKVAREFELVPAFLTITLPSSFHPKSDKYNDYTPRQSALYLSDIWSKFLRLKIFKHIRDNSGHKMIYIRVYEPHKSGVPHLHAMIFIPKIFLHHVKKKFYEHYTKYDFKRVGLKFITRFDKSHKYDGVTGAIAYILKYMNKTFKSAESDTMSNEAYYFAYHGIRRFITSQTLVPLWLYRKIKHNEETRDLYHLTKLYKEGHIYTSFNKEYITQRYIKKERIEYAMDDIEIVSSVEEKVIYQKNHFISNQFKFDKKYYDPIPKKIIREKHPIPLYINNKKFHYINGNVIELKKHITDMNDFELLNRYNTYDVENSSYTHYIAIRNLLINRGLLDGEVYNLSNFSIDEFFSIKKD
jgi:hypothetical protein